MLRQRIDRFVQGQLLPPRSRVVKLLAVEKEPRGDGTAFLWAFVVVIEVEIDTEPV